MFLLDFACTRFIENMEKSLDITAFSLSPLIGNICTGSISTFRASDPGGPRCTVMVSGTTGVAGIALPPYITGSSITGRMDSMRAYTVASRSSWGTNMGCRTDTR